MKRGWGGPSRILAEWREALHGVPARLPEQPASYLQGLALIRAPAAIITKLGSRFLRLSGGDGLKLDDPGLTIGETDLP